MLYPDEFGLSVPKTDTALPCQLLNPNTGKQALLGKSVNVGPRPAEVLSTGSNSTKLRAKQYDTRWEKFTGEEGSLHYE